MTTMPPTLQTLRQYVLHLLFAPPAPSPGITTTDGAASVRNLFPFPHKPNTLDRDRIVVPAGWDSWGKIAVLREGFDAKGWGEAWEHDLEQRNGETGESSARKMYNALVEDRGIKVNNDLLSCKLFILTVILLSLHPYQRSITRLQSKSSWRRIMTRIQRSRTAIHGALSRILQIILRQALLGLWAAAASTCLM